MFANTARTAVAAASVALLSGCAGGGLGTVGDVLGGVLNPGSGGQQQQGEVVAEVQSVDTRGQEIVVRTQDGQTGSLVFDGNTVVVYQQQQYPVTALERGDIARFQIRQVAQNQYYTERVDVQQSVQERTGRASTSSPSGDMERIYGQVGQIDRQNGIFELQTNRGSYTVVVATAFDTPAVDRFYDLQRGENVQIEGVIAAPTRIDLYRFL